GKFVLRNLAGLHFFNFLFQKTPFSLAMDRSQGVAELETRVPDFEDSHIGEFEHVLAVRPNTSQSCFTLISLAKSIGTRREYETGGEPFEIPFPGARKSLIEVVDIKNQPALGRGEAAEVK